MNFQEESDVEEYTEEIIDKKEDESYEQKRERIKKKYLDVISILRKCCIITPVFLENYVHWEDFVNNINNPKYSNSNDCNVIDETFYNDFLSTIFGTEEFKVIMSFKYFNNDTMFINSYEVFPKERGFGRKGFEMMRKIFPVETRGIYVLYFKSGTDCFFMKMRSENLINDIFGKLKNCKRLRSKRDWRGFELSDDDKDIPILYCHIEKKIRRRIRKNTLIGDEESFQRVTQVMYSMEDLFNNNYK